MCITITSKGKLKIAFCLPNPWDTHGLPNCHIMALHALSAQVHNFQIIYTLHLRPRPSPRPLPNPAQKMEISGDGWVEWSRMDRAGGCGECTGGVNEGWVGGWGWAWHWGEWVGGWGWVQGVSSGRAGWNGKSKSKMNIPFRWLPCPFALRKVPRTSPVPKLNWMETQKI